MSGLKTWVVTISNASMSSLRVLLNPKEEEEAANLVRQLHPARLQAICFCLLDW